MHVKDLAEWLGAPWEGDGALEVQRVAALEDAGWNDVAFATRGRGLKQAADSAAGCLLVPEDFDNSAQRTIIRTKDPRAAAARAIRKLQPSLEPTSGIHPSAVLGPGVVCGKGVQGGDRSFWPTCPGRTAGRSVVSNGTRLRCFFTDSRLS